MISLACSLLTLLSESPHKNTNVLKHNLFTNDHITALLKVRL